MKIYLPRRHALLVEDGAFSHKIDYTIFLKGNSKSWRASKLHNWFKSYGDFAEWLDYAYWWSFSGEGSASAACAAGRFYKGISRFSCKSTPNAWAPQDRDCIKTKPSSLGGPKITPGNPKWKGFHEIDHRLVKSKCKIILLKRALRVFFPCKGELLFSSVEQLKLIHVHWLCPSSKMHHLLAQ